MGRGETEGSPGIAPGKRGRIAERTASAWDNLKASFGFLPACGLLLGVALGVGLPYLDVALHSRLPLIRFASIDAARSLLDTIATVTMSVAGLALSVTLVAFTLASSQLSPRLFTLFLHHIVRSLQPATLIERMERDAVAALGDRYPDGIGAAREDGEGAASRARERMRAGPGRPVVTEESGFLGSVRGEGLMETATEADSLVRQRVSVGEFVVPGDVLAEVWTEDDEVIGRVRKDFVLASQRSHPQDVVFAIRQLSDVALKGLSPGINDPTTAENAMNALGAALVRFAGAESPSLVREDSEGHPRLVARAPDLEDLVHLGFEQVRVFAAPYPVVAVRLLELLERIDRAGRRAGRPSAEVARQARLLAERPRARSRRGSTSTGSPPPSPACTRTASAARWGPWSPGGT